MARFPKTSILALLLACLALSAHAQQTDSLYLAQIEQMMDSLQREQQVRQAVSDYEVKLLREETRFHYDGTLSLLTGLVQVKTNNSFIDRDGRGKYYAMDYSGNACSLLPMAAAYSLKFLGVESRSKYPRFLTASVMSYGFAYGISEVLKHSVEEVRPDRPDTHSFPSSHTALAFAGATFLNREFGHHSPWISVAGYATATLTEYFRLHTNKHYVNDILMGAGIGVVSTNLAYFLTDQIFRKRYINAPQLYMADIARYGRFMTRPMSLALSSGTEITSKTFDCGGKKFHTSSTFTTALDYTYFFNANWAAEAQVRYATTKVKADEAKISSENLDQYHATLGVKYSLPVTPQHRMAVKAVAGNCYTAETTFTNRAAKDTYLTIDGQNAFEFGGGLSFDIMDTQKYITTISFDYLHTTNHILPNKFLISSSWRILL